MPLVESSSCNLVLYTNPWSRGQIARWMLEEIGEPYRQVVLDYGTTMKSPDYLKINPMGKVPTVQHNGRVITECAAICAYMADAFPKAGLAPAPDERADYYRWMFFAAGPVEASIADRMLKVQIPEEQQRSVGYGTYERTVDVLAQAVTRHPYIAGPKFTAADVYVGSHILWGMQFGSLPKRPEFEAYAAKLTERPAYKAGKEIDNRLGEELAARQGKG